MAKALTFIENNPLHQGEEQALAIADVVEALANSREAVLVTLDILTNLNDMGLLGLIQGVVKERTEVGTMAIQMMNQPGPHRVLKNLMNALEFLGKVQPAQVETIFNGLTNGLQRALENPLDNKTLSLWGLGKGLRDPEVMTSLYTILGFIHGVGEVFAKEQREIH
jgi:uncharacterized protein YjgD (DUF1641 family)